jgi:hypothetical protein
VGLTLFLWAFHKPKMAEMSMVKWPVRMITLGVAKWFNLSQGDKSMGTLSRARPEPTPSQAAKVAAIKKAVQQGVYEVNCAEVANMLILHLLTPRSCRYS